MNRHPASTAYIAATLRERIASGVFPPNSKLPFRHALGRDFNAALGTVQRAIDLLVAEGFIHCTPGKGTFVLPLPPCKADIALVFSNGISSRSIFCDAIRKISWSISRDHDYRLHIFELHDDQQERNVATLVSLIAGHRLAGIIVVSPSTSILETLHGPVLPNVPLVVIGQEGRNFPQLPRVEVDQAGFVQTAIAFLHGRGRRRIAHIIADAMTVHLDDTHDKICELGCENNPYLVQFVGEGHRWRGAEQIAHLLMRLPAHERPNGLIVHDDNLVQRTSMGLSASGIRIPEDLEVVVHANFPCPPPSVVPVTLCGFDARAVMESAIDILANHHVIPEQPILIKSMLTS